VARPRKASFVPRPVEEAAEESAEESTPTSDEGEVSPGEHDPFLQGMHDERRKSLRRKGKIVEVKVRDGDAQSDMGSGWVMDRSVGGMCVAMDEPLPVGAVLSVKVVRAPDSVPWVKLEVKSCRAREGRFELGCQFVQQPTWNVLMLFG